MSIFPDFNKNNESEPPNHVLAKNIQGFPEKTNNTAQLRVLPVAANTNSYGFEPFSFELVLESKKIPSFSFVVFRMVFGASFYPVKFYLDSDIGSEIGEPKHFYPHIAINDEKSFQEALKKIFNSKKFISTVSALMRVSDKI